MEQTLILTRKSLYELQEKKRNLESHYNKELHNYAALIKRQQLDLKVMELRLKDKDNAVRSNMLR